MLHSNIYYIDLEALICDVKKGKTMSNIKSKVLVYQAKIVTSICTIFDINQFYESITSDA